MTYSKQQIIKFFKQSVIEGQNRAKIIANHKKKFNLNDEEIDWIIAGCNFVPPPKNIDYSVFYNNQICSIAKPIPTSKAQIYTIENFLSPIDCKLLIGVIQQDAKRAHTVSGISKQRTSSLTCLKYREHAFYLSIDQKLAALMNIHPYQAETIQGQKYEIGEFYKPHWDSFTKTLSDYQDFVQWLGDRTWTSMIYLNDVEEGGETNFPALNIKIKPKRGTLLTWNNLNKDGTRNVATKHEALAPVSGPKYIITKWWRSWMPL